jgi:hypothetical protein
MVVHIAGTAIRRAQEALEEATERADTLFEKAEEMKELAEEALSTWSDSTEEVAARRRVLTELEALDLEALEALGKE